MQIDITSPESCPIYYHTSSQASRTRTYLSGPDNCLHHIMCSFNAKHPEYVSPDWPKSDSIYQKCLLTTQPTHQTSGPCKDISMALSRPGRRRIVSTTQIGVESLSIMFGNKKRFGGVCESERTAIQPQRACFRVQIILHESCSRTRGNQTRRAICNGKQTQVRIFTSTKTKFDRALTSRSSRPHALSVPSASSSRTFRAHHQPLSCCQECILEDLEQGLASMVRSDIVVYHG